MSGNSKSEISEQEPLPPEPKRGRFGDWLADADDEAQSAEAELDIYLKVGKPDGDEPASLLSWWKGKASMFTRLSRLARRVLAIPATSASN